MVVSDSIPSIPTNHTVPPSSPTNVQEDSALTPLHPQDNDHNNTFKSSIENNNSMEDLVELPKSPPSPLTNNSPIILRRSTRTRQAPSYLHDYHCQIAHTTPNSHLPQIHTAHPLHQYLNQLKAQFNKLLRISYTSGILCFAFHL
ncbi:hypothetical protein CIPAW_08G176100 [Carya illinoinensis]|uniref:Uncharacterized protein n=1 Tax=Carya illinoinensis TaxID=32201 RepID=A0A8T1PVE6_CARIL|nr:hypothetical protein CIPAW_08G176100 [Carya illinoinensis]